jgi:hypothetical protein
VTVGACVSRTVTVKLPLVEFPASSLAVQLTVVFPMEKVDPDGGAHEISTEESALSVAETVNDTPAPEPEVASAVMLPGSVSTGGVVSGGGAGDTTWTVIDPGATLYAPPLAATLTV